MFQLFMSFLVALGLSLPQVSTLDILSFMKYLIQSGMSVSNVSNHLTVIRSMCIIYACDTAPFGDNRIPLFIKTIKINRPLQPKLTFVIDEVLRHSIVQVSTTLQSPVTFKALYLLAFYSFLRLSNTLLHTLSSFDKSRHVCDIIFSNHSAVIVENGPKLYRTEQRLHPFPYLHLEIQIYVRWLLCHKCFSSLEVLVSSIWLYVGITSWGLYSGHGLHWTLYFS